jgi:hypothetical protein
VLQLGTHSIHHPTIHYVSSYEVETVRLEDILSKDEYKGIEFNFLNFDIQGMELRALKGMEKYLDKVDCVYTEINTEYVYEGCCLVEELDEYLGRFGLVGMETKMPGDGKWHWGDKVFARLS